MLDVFNTFASILHFIDMGRLYIPEINSVDGPWLIGHKKLESLNKLFNEIDAKLKEALKNTLESAAKQQMDEESQIIDLSTRITKLERKNNKKEKFAKVIFSDGSSYEAEDIEALINYVDTNPSQTPIELYIGTIQGNHENEFLIAIDTNPEDNEPDFEYTIRCLDEEIEQKIKTIIDKWIRENRPSRTIQIWSKITGVILFIGIGVAIISGLFIDSTPSAIDNYKFQLKKDAHKIIENQDHTNLDSSAILLILKLQSDYVSQDIRIAKTESKHDKGALKIFIASLIIILSMSINPKTIIGIGSNYNKLKLYEFWIRFRIVILGLFASTFLADNFLKFINW